MTKSFKVKLDVMVIKHQKVNRTPSLGKYFDPRIEVYQEFI